MSLVKELVQIWCALDCNVMSWKSIMKNDIGTWHWHLSSRQDKQFPSVVAHLFGRKSASCIFGAQLLTQNHDQWMLVLCWSALHPHVFYELLLVNSMSFLGTLIGNNRSVLSVEFCVNSGSTERTDLLLPIRSLEKT